MTYREDEAREKESWAALGEASRGELKAQRRSNNVDGNGVTFSCHILAQLATQVGGACRAEQGESTSASDLGMVGWRRRYMAAELTMAMATRSPVTRVRECEVKQMSERERARTWCGSSLAHPGQTGRASAGVRLPNGGRGLLLVGHDIVLKSAASRFSSVMTDWNYSIVVPLSPKPARTTKSSNKQTCRAMWVIHFCLHEFGLDWLGFHVTRRQSGVGWNWNTAHDLENF
jgi:hypothetical protein